MDPDPYLWTWLARWGGACALCAGWAALALRRIGADPARATVLGLLALVTGGALWTHLGPLLTNAPLPAEPAALALVGSAPLVAFSALALLQRPAPPGGRFDLAALAPIAPWSYGWPAWLLATVLMGRGLTLPGAARGRLVSGLLALGLAAALEAGRLDVERALPLGIDAAPRAAAALVSASETCGWALVGVALSRPTPTRDQSST